MLAAVLEDRFRLKSHRESRQMPVYDLSAQASGIRLPETVPGSCTPFDPNAAPPATPEEATKRAEDTCGGGVFLRLPEGGVHVFAALKKVGLSLTSDRGGVEVMVIDHLERPSEN